jgi:hypothetical protein
MKMRVKGIGKGLSRSFVIILTVLVSLFVVTMVRAAGYASVALKLISNNKDNLYTNSITTLASSSYLGLKVAFDTAATDIYNNEQLCGTKLCTPDVAKEDIYLYDATGSSTVYTLISKSKSQSGKRASGSSDLPSISRTYVSGDDAKTKTLDGQFIAFRSASTDLDFWDVDTSGIEFQRTDSNGFKDIYLYQSISGALSGKTWRASLANDGGEANGNSGYIHRSGNSIRNLNHPVAAVYAEFTGNDVAHCGEPPPPLPDPPYPPCAYARPYVIFESDANNLIAPAADTNGKEDIFIRDIRGIYPPYTFGSAIDPSTKRLSVTATGSSLNGDSSNPAITRDGRFLAFVSDATNVIPGGTPSGIQQVYVMDRDADGDGIYDEFSESNSVKIYLVSRNIDMGTPGNHDSNYPSIAFDGFNVYVAFESLADNLGPSNLSGSYPLTDADFVGMSQIYAYRLMLSTEDEVMNIASLSSMNDFPGQPGMAFSLSPVMSDDGSMVSFGSFADNLVDGDTNYNCWSDLPKSPTNCEDVFVRKVDYSTVSSEYSGATWRVSMDKYGQQGQANSSMPLMANSGRIVTLTSYANLLKFIEFGTRLNYPQIFQRDQGDSLGNPNLQPSTWDFYRRQGQPVEKSFRITFLKTGTTLGYTLPVGLPDSPADYPFCTMEGSSDPEPCPLDQGIKIYEQDEDPVPDPTHPNRIYYHESDVYEYSPGSPTDCFAGYTSVAVGDICSYTIRFDPGGDSGIHDATILVPINDERYFLYLPLRGRTIVLYMPMLHLVLPE